MPDWNLEERPNRLPWPPILLLLGIAKGLAMHALAPLPLPGNRSALRYGGGAIVLLALAIDVWAAITFRHARTTILPHRGTDNLTTGGPFAFSRNPIYVGNLVLLAGVGLMSASVWPLLLVPFVALAIDRLAIRREEAHLAARFGEAWTAYAARVRRWL